MKNEAFRLGRAAAGGLIGREFCRENWNGRVHSVFRRAANVRSGDLLFSLIAEPLWISETGALAGPATLAAARPGAPCSFTDGRLRLDGEPVEDYRRAEIWRGPDLNPGGEPPALAGLNELAAALAARPAAPLLAAVRRKFLEQAAVFTAGGRADFGAVIGAGPGLTPAGDDMICGLSLALACLAPARLAELAENCRPTLGGTTDISRHLLQQAWRGSFGFPLLNLLFAVQGRADLEAALQLAFSIGAGSGLDGSFGLYHGLRLLADQAA